MSNSLGSTRRVWLFILKQGGRWSGAELATALTDLRSVDGLACNMAKHGYLKRFPKLNRGDRVTYGVTRDCKVPLGIAVEDLLATGVLREPT